MDAATARTRRLTTRTYRGVARRRQELLMLWNEPTLVGTTATAVAVRECDTPPAPRPVRDLDLGDVAAAFARARRQVARTT